MIVACLICCSLAQEAPDFVGVRDDHQGTVLIQRGRLADHSKMALVGKSKSVSGALYAESVVSPSGTMLALSLQGEINLFDLVTMRSFVRRKVKGLTEQQWDPGAEFFAILNSSGELVVVSGRSGRVRLSTKGVLGIQWTGRGTLFAMRKGENVFQAASQGTLYNLSAGGTLKNDVNGAGAFNGSVFAASLSELSQDCFIGPRLLDYEDTGSTALFLIANAVGGRDSDPNRESISYLPEMESTFISVGKSGYRKWTKTYPGMEIIAESARLSHDGKTFVMVGSNLHPFGKPKRPEEKGYVATINLESGGVKWQGFDDRGFRWYVVRRPKTTDFGSPKAE